MNTIELTKEVKRLVHSLRYEKGFVCSVEVLKQLNYLSKEDYENWRFGRVDFLEKVCKVNLKKLSDINKLIRKFASELKLESSWTAYNQYGKGKNKRLQFSKSNNPRIEELYATHFIDKNRIEELKKEKKK